MKVGSCSLQAAWGARRRPREQRRSARGEAGLRATATGVRGDGAARAARRAGVCGAWRNLRGHPLIPPSPRQHVATWGHPHLHPPGYKYPGVQPPPSRNPAARKQLGGRACTPGVCKFTRIHCTPRAPVIGDLVNRARSEGPRGVTRRTRAPSEAHRPQPPPTSQLALRRAPRHQARSDRSSARREAPHRRAGHSHGERFRFFSRPPTPEEAQRDPGRGSSPPSPTTARRWEPPRARPP